MTSIRSSRTTAKASSSPAPLPARASSNQSGTYILQLADGTGEPRARRRRAHADYAPTVPTTEFGDLAFLRSPPRGSLSGWRRWRLCLHRTGPPRDVDPAQPRQLPTRSTRSNSTASANKVNTFPGYVSESRCRRPVFSPARDGPFLLGPGSIRRPLRLTRHTRQHVGLRSPPQNVA